MKEEKLTEAELKKKKEEVRIAALDYLNDKSFMNFVGTYLAHNSNRYGDGGMDAVEEYKYWPSYNQGKTGAIDKELIKGSREHGRFSGNISELQKLNEYYKIFNDALLGIKVEDILERTGITKVSEKYKDKYEKYKGKYISDLIKEDKDFVTKKLMPAYQTYLAEKIVAESLTESVKNKPKTLEDFLFTDEKPKEAT